MDHGTGGRYCNPVHPGYFADPCVVRDGDRYVAVGTGRVVDGLVFEVLVSDDLVGWRSTGGALEPAAAGLGDTYWAPELVEAEGRWWMYYSVGREDVGHHLRVAVADRATGPYRDCGVDLSPAEPFAIDPSPFLDVDGTWYLFHARDVLDGDRVGTMIAVDVLTSMTSLAGQTRTVLRPSADWQLFRAGRPIYGRVHDWHTLEGPFVVRRDGRYHLFYSGGNWELPGYGVGTATADHPLGPWREDPGGPLLRTVPGRVLGPGHNTVVTTPAGLDVMAYHAWDPDRTARRLCLDPLYWVDGRPVLDGPTWTPTTLDRLPDVTPDRQPLPSQGEPSGR